MLNPGTKISEDEQNPTPTTVNVQGSVNAATAPAGNGFSMQQRLKNAGYAIANTARNHKVASITAAVTVVGSLVNLAVACTEGRDCLKDMRAFGGNANNVELGFGYAAMTIAGSALNAAAGEGLSRAAGKIQQMWKGRSAAPAPAEQALLLPADTATLDIKN